MKIQTFIASLLLVLGLSACSINNGRIMLPVKTVQGSGNIVEVNRVVSNFNLVDMTAIGNLTITQGDQESLLIKADDNLIDSITTEVQGGVLKISMEPNFSVNPSQTIEYHLTVKDLAGVTLSGFGNIDADQLSASSLQVKLQGSGNINIGKVSGNALTLQLAGFGNIEVNEMNVDRVSLELTGSGDTRIGTLEGSDLNVRMGGFGSCTINGKVTTQDIRISGSGNYHAGDLESETASLVLSGFGRATLWPKESLTVTITGSGGVDYYGNPHLDQTVTGFGDIKSLGEH